MIARTWRGVTRAQDADACMDMLRRTGLRDFDQTEGNPGALVLRRIEPERAELIVMSFWHDLDAVKRFAGESYERARFYPEDEAFLIERDEHTHHYEVTYASLAEIARIASAQPSA